eukprot:m51a1_g6075 hypothetical protein (1598) ;mRNA; f:293404-300521
MRSLLVVVTALCALAVGDDCKNTYAAGSLSIGVNGKPLSVAAIQVGGATSSLSTAGGSLTALHNIRTYFADGCPAAFGPNIFHDFPLLGASFNFTVDLSTVHCGCNAALYTVSMPGYNPDGTANHSQSNDFYCDANQVGGVFCPEVDLMEANQYSFVVTLHKCDKPQGKYYADCDKGGCGKNFAEVKGAYGPGEQYKINTNKPFIAGYEFRQANGQLTGVFARLTQGPNVIAEEITGCRPNYFQELTAPLKAGMAVALSHWGDGTMEWLDKDRCNTSCDKSGRLVVSDFQWSDGSSAPAPQPSGSLSSSSAEESTCDSDEKVPECKTAVVPGSFTYGSNGQHEVLSVVQLGGASSSLRISGDSITAQHNIRTYFADDCPAAFGPNIFHQFPMLGASFNFTVDLSTIHCGCNAALYTASMPGFNPDGTVNHSESGDYYCDANQVGGVWCPEVDLMEANQYSFAATLHQCVKPQGKYYASCDKGGCGMNFAEMKGAYGPGAQYKIDTNKPFVATYEFHQANGQLSKWVVKLSQGANVVTADFSHCRAEYLHAMTEPLKAGMTVILSHWGDGKAMEWLDKERCHTPCDKSGRVVISGFQWAEIGSDPAPQPQASSASFDESSAASTCDSEEKIPECKTSVAAGSLAVGFDGQREALAVVQVGGANGNLRASGDTVTAQHNIRAYFADNCPASFGPNIFHDFPLLGASFNFTVDLSTVHCGCNAALYTVSMPGFNPDGTANPSQSGDYYCDANQVGGVWCPEVDLMEANQYSFAATLHQCIKPQGKYFASCDKSGCGKNFGAMEGAYGPGAQYKIDTTKPFVAAFEFHQTNGQLSNWIVRLSQGTHSVAADFSDCGAEYLHAMTDPLKAGMTVALSHWGDGAMEWLDKDRCHTPCDKSGHVSVSNFQWAGLGQSPAPSPSSSSSSAPHSSAAPVAPSSSTHPTAASSTVAVSWAALSDCKNTVVPGALSIGVNGKSQDVAAIQLGGASDRLTTAGSTITGQHNIRTYFADGCPTAFGPNIYHQFSMLGASFNFTVDLSTIHCGCNAALYTVAMPGFNLDGTANHSQSGDYYCDANQVGGVWCPEVDLMEANQYSFAATLHKCVKPQGKYYASCDKGGCGKNFGAMSGTYGPGSSYKIDTTKPFIATYEFPATDGQLSNWIVKLTQGANVVTADYSNCGNTYLHAMTDTLRAGQVVVLSHWGEDTMEWLDNKRCNTPCDKSGRIVISDFQWTQAEVPAPASSAEQSSAKTAGCSTDVVPGSLSVDLNGKPQDLAAVQLGGASDRLTTSGATITGQHNIRAYFADGCPAAFGPNIYHQFPLLGASLNFTIDLSTVHCGCNAALYTASMPGYNLDGTANHSQAWDYYCDANQVGGVWCPEVDLMEANQYSFAATLHKCVEPQGKYFASCDKGGCGKNFGAMEGAYGPGAQYKINTNKPFVATFEFPQSNGQLSNWIVKLSQGANVVTADYSNCGTQYLHAMTDPLKAGMAVILSHWGDDTMEWLDNKRCSTPCDKSGHIIIRDFQWAELPAAASSSHAASSKTASSKAASSKTASSATPAHSSTKPAHSSTHVVPDSSAVVPRSLASTAALSAALCAVVAAASL